MTNKELSREMLCDLHENFTLKNITERMNILRSLEVHSKAEAGIIESVYEASVVI